jgi:hypothetical protein
MLGTWNKISSRWMGLEGAWDELAWSRPRAGNSYLCTGGEHDENKQQTCVESAWNTLGTGLERAWSGLGAGLNMLVSSLEHAWTTLGTTDLVHMMHKLGAPGLEHASNWESGGGGVELICLTHGGLIEALTSSITTFCQRRSRLFAVPCDAPQTECLEQPA